MAPKKFSQASPPINQPSISSFFKRKDPPSSSPVKPSQKHPKPEPMDDNDGPLFLPDNDKENPIVIDSSPEPSPPPEKKARKSVIAQLTLSPFAGPTSSFSRPTPGPSKSAFQSKVSNGPPTKDDPSVSKPSFSKQPPSSSRIIMGKWKYNGDPERLRVPATDDDQMDVDILTDVEAEKERAYRAVRHEKFKARLLEQNFGRRRSLDLEQAEMDDYGQGDWDGEVDTGAAEEEEEEDMAGGSKMKVLREKLSAKGKGGKQLLVGAKGKGKAKEQIGPSGLTYTPLEKQVLELKERYPGVLLIFEVGYKFRFFGEDSKTAARHLNIVSFPDRNFTTASIPAHRLDIHIKNLISQGYKVGVVRQMETAALKKVGDNRNAPFTRQLTNLYTSATYVDEISSMDNSTSLGALPSTVPPSNALLVIVEGDAQGKGKGKPRERQDATIGLVSVVPATGDVIWDEFEDSAMRTELETRMTHIQPQEILLPASKLSRSSEKMLAAFCNPGASTAADRVRVERIGKELDLATATDLVSNFYLKKARKTGKAEGDEASVVTEFPKQVVIALAHAICHLEEFNLSSALINTRTTFTRFTTMSHMLLNANTLHNLEIYRNSDNGGERGSLLWILDHSVTRMGRRLLREWVGRPLVLKSELQARVNAVEEIIDDDSGRVERLRSLLKGLPDLPKGLVRIQYGRSTPAELISILVNLKRVALFCQTSPAAPFRSPLLNSIIDSFETILDPITTLFEATNERKARDNIKADLWIKDDKYPAILDTKDMISACDHELSEELAKIRTFLKRPKAEFITVSGIENLIEVKTLDVKRVPADWIKISSTKAVVRFHTPAVLKIVREKEQHREMLEAEAQKAFLSFLEEVSESYDTFRTVATHLATLDCLFSLALTATQPGFNKPIFTDEHQLRIEGGFHPMVSALRDDEYIPNDVTMTEASGRTKIITGPNMGGKSSMVRMIALTVLMAQIGSYVPAASANIGLHDAIFTRMGATDELTQGKSTFMVEISETADILKSATPKSLVILDELGRGTSTFDGMAIAEAVLYHISHDLKCNTLFITHYPLVATSIAKQLRDVSNWHMSFAQTPRADGSAEITFLYRLSPGLANASFGIECARLAGVPDAVLVRAREQSAALKETVNHKAETKRAAQTRDFLRAALMLEEKGSTDEQSKAKGLRAARTLADAVLNGSKGL